MHLCNWILHENFHFVFEYFLNQKHLVEKWVVFIYFLQFSHSLPCMIAVKCKVVERKVVNSSISCSKIQRWVHHVAGSHNMLCNKRIHFELFGFVFPKEMASLRKPAMYCRKKRHLVPSPPPAIWYYSNLTDLRKVAPSLKSSWEL